MLFLFTDCFDMTRPLLSINLENVQATTRDLATLLGIALPEYSNRIDRSLPAGLPRLQGTQVSVS
jgi:hypothetical protein